MDENSTSDATETVASSTNPISVERTCRVIGGSYCDDGYGFIEAANADGWRAISAWGRDGWDLGDWPYVVYVFRGDTERAWYCEGDITIETFASAEDREQATNEAALFYWREEEWASDPSDPKLRGPFTWKRLDAETAA